MHFMDFLILSGAVVGVGVAFSFGYRMIRRRRGECEPESQVMNKINDFYATQDQEHNY